MPRESAAAKGRRYLCEGRLIVEEVDLHHVSATCRGDGAVHYCTWFAGTWSCTCPAKTTCCHLQALRLVSAPDLGDEPTTTRGTTHDL